jgi:hypothetical protein
MKIDVQPIGNFACDWFMGPNTSDIDVANPEKLETPGKGVERPATN